MRSGAGRGMEVVGGDGESGFCLEGWPRAWSPCPACLEPRLASSAGWQPADQSRWAPPPILPALTGSSSLPGES